MSALESVLWKRFIMKSLGRFRIQGETELLVPIKFKASSGECVITIAGPGSLAGNVRSVGGDLVGNDPLPDIFLVR